MNDIVYPKRGDTFLDCDGRKLLVTEVNPGDAEGREIVGKLTEKGEYTQPGSDYACDQKIWHAIWKEQKPRAQFRL